MRQHIGMTTAAPVELEIDPPSLDLGALVAHSFLGRRCGTFR